MKKFFKILILFIILALTLNILSLNSHANSDLEPYLILNFEDINSLPINFRKTTNLSKLENSKIDLIGLDTLNMSGSSEFTSLSLKNIIENLNTKLPITIIDLRQESHGFINGNAVSWYIKNNKANAGLNLNQVNQKEMELLRSIPLDKSITLTNPITNSTLTLTPKTIQTESKLASLNNLNYIRIPVLDNHRSTDDMVDKFVSFINNTDSSKNWLHFHCQEGDGRTTTFMIMYDIMKNSNNIELENIIKRQAILGGIDFSRFDKNDIRLIFINNFYQYARDSNNNFNTAWSDWIKKNNVKAYTLEDDRI